MLTKPVGRAEFVDLTKRMGMAARSKISDGVLNLRERERVVVNTECGWLLLTVLVY